MVEFLLDLRNAVESGQDLDGAMGYLQLEEEQVSWINTCNFVIIVLNQAENDEDTLTDTTSDTGTWSAVVYILCHW